jgi:hypothetical protein
MGRVYISRDAIFDESVFPFASLNPNVSAHYTTDVLLLPNFPSQINSDLSVDNIQTNTCLSPTRLWSSELMHPQRI